MATRAGEQRQVYKVNFAPRHPRVSSRNPRKISARKWPGLRPLPFSRARDTRRSGNCRLRDSNTNGNRRQWFATLTALFLRLSLCSQIMRREKRKMVSGGPQSGVNSKPWSPSGAPGELLARRFLLYCSFCAH